MKAEDFKMFKYFFSILVILGLCFVTTNANAEPGDWLWDYTTGDDVASSPAAVGDKVFVGSNDGKLYCLDVKTGDKLWSYETTGGAITSSPAVREGKIFFGAYDNKFYCLDAQTGDKQWEYETGAPIGTSPAISRGKVLFGSGFDGDTLYCLDKETGERLWDYKTNGAITSSPATDGTRLFFGSNDKHLHCLDIETGEKEWAYPTGGSVGSSPAINNGKVFFGSSDGKFYCLNGETGEKLWEYATDGQIWSSPAIAYGKVFFGGTDQNLYCLNAENGNKQWTYPTGAAIYSSPAISGNSLFFGCADNFYCLDIKNDTPDFLWNYPSGGEINSSSAISDGRIFFGSNDDKLHCLDAGAPDIGGWSMFMHDLQHTGDTDHYKTEFLYGIFQVWEITEFGQYELQLTEFYEDIDLSAPSDAGFIVSDPEIASLSGNRLTAQKNGLVIISSDQNGNHYEHTLFVMVSPDGFETPGNDTAENAENLPPDQFRKGDLNSGSVVDKDFYKLTIDEEMCLVRIGYLSEGDVSDVRIELTDEQGYPLISEVSDNGQNKVLSAVLVRGEYYLKITPAGDVDQNGSYYISYSPVPGLQYETDPNDTFETGTEINQDESIYGIMGDGDVDFYTFSLDVPNYVRIDFIPQTDDTEYALTLYREDDQHPLDDVICPKGLSPVSVEAGLAGGDYHLEVKSKSLRSSGDQPFYTIALTDSDNTQLEIEPNDTLSFANPLDSSRSRKGKVYSHSDTDYYGFFLSEEIIVQLDFRSDTGTADYNISIINGSGNAVYSKTSEDGSDISLERKLLPGNYYVRIEAGEDTDPNAWYDLSTPTGLIVYPKSLVRITLSSEKDQIAIHESSQLTAMAYYSDATVAPVGDVVWSSSADAVAAVDETGLVTRKSDGYVIIYASSQGQPEAGQFAFGEKPFQNHGNLILVAGGGDDESDALYDSTQYLSDMVYSRFRGRGFEGKDICYFNSVPFHDTNGDGYDDAIVTDETPTVDELLQTIKTWASDQESTGPLYLVLIDHGGKNSFQVNQKDQILEADDLKVSLSKFEATGRDVVLIIEACKSGSFSESLSDPGTSRMIITCTDEGNAYTGYKGRTSFTQFFMDKLYTGGSFRESFNYAETQMENCGTPYSRMKPQLVETGDSLSQKSLGGNFVLASLFPEIMGPPNTAIQGRITHTFEVNVSDLSDLSDLSGRTEVWAVAEPPGYEAPTLVDDLKAPVTALPTFELTDDENGVLDGVFTGEYEDFTCNGDYNFVFYARNEEGLVAVSPPTRITVTGIMDLDFDNDGRINDIGDAVMGLKILTGGSATNTCRDWDINGDKKIGMEEILHILQMAAELEK